MKHLLKTILVILIMAMASSAETTVKGNMSGVSIRPTYSSSSFTISYSGWYTNDSPFSGSVQSSIQEPFPYLITVIPPPPLGCKNVTITPSKLGYRFEPVNRTYQYLHDTTGQDFLAIDTMPPAITLVSPTFTTWVINEKDSLRFFVSDNCAWVSKYRFFYSIDSGTTYALIDTVLATTDNEKRALITDNPANPNSTSIKRIEFRPTKLSYGYKFKFEAIDPDGNTGVGYTNIIAVIDTTKPTVSLTSPNGSEEWDVTSTHNITWIANDNVTVGSRAIYYSNDNGSNWSSLDSAAGNTGSWPWLISVPPSNQYKVRVRVYDQSGNMQEDISDAVFEITDTVTIDTIKPTIVVIAPAANEDIAQGTTYNITWAANDNRGIVSRKIEYSWAGYPYQLLSESTGNTGTWPWNIADGNINIDRCKIKITVTDSAGNTNFHESGEFEIKDLTPPTVTLKYPITGQTYVTTCYVGFDAWDTMGVASRSLWLSLDDGKSYTFIDSMQASNLEFNYKSWNVHTIASNDCRVKLRVYDTRGNCNETISGKFVIRDGIAPTITISQPDGGNVIAGSKRIVIWHAQDFVGIDYIILELSTDSGVSYSRIDSVNPDTSQYLWSVPNTEHAHCFIKATAVDPSGNRTSANSAKFSIDILTPISQKSMAPKNFSISIMKDHFQIGMEKPDNVQISIFDLKGRLIHEKTKFLSTGYHKINRNQTAQGIYILRVVRPGKALVKKISSTN